MADGSHCAELVHLVCPRSKGGYLLRAKRWRNVRNILWSYDAPYRALISITLGLIPFGLWVVDCPLEQRVSYQVATSAKSPVPKGLVWTGGAMRCLSRPQAYG